MHVSQINTLTRQMLHIKPPTAARVCHGQSHLHSNKLQKRNFLQATGDSGYFLQSPRQPGRLPGNFSF